MLSEVIDFGTNINNYAFLLLNSAKGFRQLISSVKGQRRLQYFSSQNNTPNWCQRTLSKEICYQQWGSKKKYLKVWLH